MQRRFLTALLGLGVFPALSTRTDPDAPVFQDPLAWDWTPPPPTYDPQKVEVTFAGIKVGTAEVTITPKRPERRPLSERKARREKRRQKAQR